MLAFGDALTIITSSFFGPLEMISIATGNRLKDESVHYNLLLRRVTRVHRLLSRSGHAQVKSLLYVVYGGNHTLLLCRFGDECMAQSSVTYCRADYAIDK
jgi:hypothetical protein